MANPGANVKPILVATPTFAFGDQIRRSLEETGLYQVRLVTDIEETLKAFAGVTYPVILLDGEIVEAGLAELIRYLRQTFPRARLMLVPPDNDLNHPLFSEFPELLLLTRPYDPADLLSALEKLSTFEPSAAAPAAAEPDPSRPSPAFLEHLAASAQALGVGIAESGGGLVTGGLPAESAPALTALCAPYWQREERGDLLRFTRFPAPGGSLDCLVYLTALPGEPESALLLVYPIRTPLGKVRAQAAVLAQELAAANAAARPGGIAAEAIANDVATDETVADNGTAGGAVAGGAVADDGTAGGLEPPAAVEPENSVQETPLPAGAAGQGPVPTEPTLPAAFEAGEEADSFGEPPAWARMDSPSPVEPAAPPPRPAPADLPPRPPAEGWFTEDDLPESETGEEADLPSFNLADLLGAIPSPDPNGKAARAPLAGNGYHLAGRGQPEGRRQPEGRGQPEGRRQPRGTPGWPEEDDFPAAADQLSPDDNWRLAWAAEFLPPSVWYPSQPPSPAQEPPPPEPSAAQIPETPAKDPDRLRWEQEVLAAARAAGQAAIPSDSAPRGALIRAEELEPSTAAAPQPMPDAALSPGAALSPQEPLPPAPLCPPLAPPVFTPAPGAPLGEEGETAAETDVPPTAFSQLNQLEPSAAGLSLLHYTCVLLPRLPRHTLTGELGEQLGQWVQQLCLAFGWRLEGIALRPDYLQWTVQVAPSIPPGDLVQTVRRQTSELIFASFEQLARQNPSGDFWAAGYLIVSGAQPPSAGLLRDYIQQTRQRQGVLKTPGEDTPRLTP